MLPPPGEQRGLAKPCWDRDSAPLALRRWEMLSPCAAAQLSGSERPGCTGWHPQHRPGARRGRCADGKRRKASPACVVCVYRQLPAICLPEKGGVGLRCWPTGVGLPLKSPQLVF